MADPQSEKGRVLETAKEVDPLRAPFLWLRPLRKLFAEGAAPGRSTVLTVEPPGHGSYIPFAVLCETPGSRLCLFPPLGEGAHARLSTGGKFPLDHVTVERDRRRLHATGYKASGKSVHVNLGWAASPIAGKGLAFWFGLACRWSDLIAQHVSLKARISSPTTDLVRRQRELESYLQQLELRAIQLPPAAVLTVTGDWFAALFYHVTEPAGDILAPALFPIGDEQVDGWPDGVETPVQPQEILFGRERLVIVAAAPPGSLKENLVLMLPRADQPRAARQSTRP